MNRPLGMTVKKRLDKALVAHGPQPLDMLHVCSACQYVIARGTR